MSISYTPSQLQAIHHLDGNLQIIACAGSGKTQVLSQRIVNILKTKGIDGIRPENIVAFTFTNKAAAELKSRIHTLCEQQLGTTVGLAAMYVGTIHGFGLHLLQNHLPQFQKYSVLDEVQQRLFIDRFPQQSGLTDLRANGKCLERWKDSKLYQRILSIMRESGIIASQLGCDNPLRESVRKYEDLLHVHCRLDFTMLLAEAVKALASDSQVQSAIRSQVKYLIVDEYQDVNPIQERLIQHLHDLGAQLCVVGDDDQTIYQWNGSDVNNILKFSERYPGVTSITLDENFRSSEGIVETARHIAELNQDERLVKKMVSAGAQPFAAGDLLSMEFENPDEEAAWIAKKIQALRGVPFSDKGGPPRGLSWSDCAILLRSVKNSAEPILRALRSAGVPYIIKGMPGLLGTAEIQACCGIFSYVEEEISTDKLAWLWTRADLGATPEEIDSAIRWLDAERERWPSVEKKTLYSLQRTYLGFLAKAKITEGRIPPAATSHLPRGEMVFYNLGKFSQLISDFEQVNFDLRWKSLYKQFNGFLRYQASEYYPEGWEAAGRHQTDAVQIMTVHQAKGMQFPAVFVPRLIHNRFPCFGPAGRQWYHVIPKEAVPNASRYQGAYSEERRLFYVALTRSQRYLFCSFGGLSPSEFSFDFYAAGPKHVTRLEFDLNGNVKLPPMPATSHAQTQLTFSHLKYYLDCPYLFKIRFLYGFDQALCEEVGYGKSLHDALAEIHRRARTGDFCSSAEVPALLDRHLHLPYAVPRLYTKMRNAAAISLSNYLRDNATRLGRTEHSELPIELKLGDGIHLIGRIDLVRHTDTGQVAIVDFKSNHRAQTEDVTRLQLDLYAAGYSHLTGKLPDLVEIYNLDEGAAAAKAEPVIQHHLDRASCLVLEVGRAVKENRCQPKQPCNGGCDFSGICGHAKC